MKGQAGMLSSVGLASCANFLNLSCWNREATIAIHRKCSLSIISSSIANTGGLRCFSLSKFLMKCIHHYFCRSKIIRYMLIKFHKAQTFKYNHAMNITKYCSSYVLHSRDQHSHPNFTFTLAGSTIINIVPSLNAVKILAMQSVENLNFQIYQQFV